MRLRSADFLWKVAPSGLQLADGNVHVFTAPLDVPANRLAVLVQWLSPDEWHRAKRFQREQDRASCSAGRGTLREILGGLLKVNPASFGFGYGEFGKPRIAAPGAAYSLHFYLAHSDSIAVYATANHELGVDLERVRAMAEAEQITSRFFRRAKRVASARCPRNSARKHSSMVGPAWRPISRRSGWDWTIGLIRSNSRWRQVRRRNCSAFPAIRKVGGFMH